MNKRKQCAPKVASNFRPFLCAYLHILQKKKLTNENVNCINPGLIPFKFTQSKLQLTALILQ